MINTYIFIINTEDHGSCDVYWGYGTTKEEGWEYAKREEEEATDGECQTFQWVMGMITIPGEQKLDVNLGNIIWDIIKLKP